MARLIRPRRIDWPSLFWSRAEGSYADNDLRCRVCDGRGSRLGREEMDKDTTVEDTACPTCRSSGLLVPARELPDNIEVILAADDAGGAWLDWIGYTGNGLLWPLPWTWTISRRRFPIKHDLYYADKNVMAFMMNGNVVIGIFRRSPAARRHLATVFRLACGDNAEIPAFIMP